MDKLRERMNAKQIHNQLVCNCHDDSDTLMIIDLVVNLYSSLDSATRTFTWHLLQEKIYSFLDEFLSHMDEEENIFQPLLMTYFEDEELMMIKEQVLQQHETWRDQMNEEYSLKEFCQRDEQEIYKEQKEQVPVRKQDQVRVLVQQKQEELKKTHQKETHKFENNLNDRIQKTVGKEDLNIESLHLDVKESVFPPEVLEHIFSFLADPRDLALAGEVCQHWYNVGRSEHLWQHLPLSSFELGYWNFNPPDEIRLRSTLTDEAEDGMLYSRLLSGGLLSVIGPGVRSLSVSGSKGVDSDHLSQILQLCPGLISLDLSYTSVNQRALSNPDLQLTSLTSLDMSGCCNVTNSMVECLDRIVKPGRLEKLSLSGCSQLTDCCLSFLNKFTSSLRRIDFSGCYRISGEALLNFTRRCSKLDPESLAYCDLIMDGPYPDLASGCNNLDCDNIRLCCLSYSN